MEYKICTKCKKEKKLDEFGNSKTKTGKKSQCKLCYVEYRDRNRDRNKKYQKEYYKKNKERDREKRKNYYYTHIEKSREYGRKGYERNKGRKRDLVNSRNRDYYRRNKEQFKERNKIKNKKWYAKNKHKKNNYVNEKRKNDPLFKFIFNLRTLIRNNITKNGYTKKSRTYEILGCSYEEFKIYIESKFKSWMTWENYGKYNGELDFGWDIDHIIPLSSVKSEEDIIKLNHHSNLQPLCSKINRDIKKGTHNN